MELGEASMDLSSDEEHVAGSIMDQTDDEPVAGAIRVPKRRHSEMEDLTIRFSPDPRSRRASAATAPNSYSSSGNQIGAASTTSSGNLLQFGRLAMTGGDAGSSQQVPSLLTTGLVESANLLSSAATSAASQANALGGSASTPLAAARPAGNLTQTQLAVGVSPMKTCAICSVSYNSTLAEDKALHLRLHEEYLMGVSVAGLPLGPEPNIRKYYLSGNHGVGDLIVEVHRYSPVAWKRLVIQVIRGHVDKHLGGVPDEEEYLWSTMRDPAGDDPDGPYLPAFDDQHVPRFKFYLFIQDFDGAGPNRVCSFLMAERIVKGYEVRRVQLQADEFGPWPSIVQNLELQITNNAHPAELGVNKIWTIRAFQKSGYARALLEYARQNFIYGMDIAADHVAWTQTTEAGASAAESYFQSDNMDCVYLSYAEDYD
jgi:hypothetical protein